MVAIFTTLTALATTPLRSPSPAALERTGDARATPAPTPLPTLQRPLRRHFSSETTRWLDRMPHVVLGRGLDAVGSDTTSAASLLLELASTTSSEFMQAASKRALEASSSPYPSPHASPFPGDGDLDNVEDQLTPRLPPSPLPPPSRGGASVALVAALSSTGALLAILSIAAVTCCMYYRQRRRYRELEADFNRLRARHAVSDTFSTARLEDVGL